ncbi:MAG: hypothetical protein J6V09_01990 [Clostridia bacterium]|nr:hypothetical protein [Clostridia bacterium]
MKKILCLTLVLVTLVFCLSSCAILDKLLGALENQLECAPKIEEMMLALAEGRKDDAMALIHPSASDEADAGITQLIGYVDGSKVAEMKAEGININTSLDKSEGKTEQAVYKITLENGTVMKLEAVYISNDQGDGFIGFKLSKEASDE